MPRSLLPSVRSLMSALWLAAVALAAPACTEEPAPCVPQCGDRLCGDNGCGGTCGLCASGLECNAGQCRCPAGKELCGADCFNTQTSLKHCGECGNACATGQACEGGACKCPSGQALCNGQCVSLATSLNCGACGVACTGGTACEAGACKCPTGTLKCGSKCVDPLTDEANCGACGTTCPSGGSNAAPICADGKCARRCLADAATELCDGTKTCCGGVGCTDTKNDPNNCGGCGEVCPSDTAAGLVGVCDDGSCRQRCANDPAGQYCAKPSSGGASACNSAGRCAVSCTNSAETVCSTSSGATCVNLSTDDGNCGLCGTRCASNQDCLEKNCATKIIRCTVQAASGWQTCNASVLPATAGTSVTATQLVDIGAFGTTGGWISGFFESLATDATRGPGRDTNPYATGDYRYNTSYRFNELLWRVNGTVSGPGPERGFNDPPVAAGRAGTIQLRINVLDGELNWADGSLTVAVSVTTP